MSQIWCKLKCIANAPRVEVESLHQGARRKPSARDNMSNLFISLQFIQEGNEFGDSTLVRGTTDTYRSNQMSGLTLQGNQAILKAVPPIDHRALTESSPTKISLRRSKNFLLEMTNVRPYERMRTALQCSSSLEAQEPLRLWRLALVSQVCENRVRVRNKSTVGKLIM